MAALSFGTVLAVGGGALLACGHKSQGPAHPEIALSKRRVEPVDSGAPPEQPDAGLPSRDASADAPPDAGKKHAPSRPLNVVLLSVDSLRADMPWAGYERPIAPRLTALAKDAIVYTRAYSCSSYTSMSLGGLLGGKPPGELKRDGYFFGTYSKDNVFFPEVLHAAGVKTLSAHAHGYFKNAGFEQGFDAWEIVPNLKWDNTTDHNVTGPQHEAIAERLLGDPSLETTPFFAWFHFLDPHDQYLPHEGIGPYGKTARDRYDAEVTFTDRQLAKLLDFISARTWADRTLLIVSADHGESFGEHHHWAHGFELWENLIHVPLFFVFPKAEGLAPHAIDLPRSAIDLAPTILELLGVGAEAVASSKATFEGQSLVPELYGAEPPAARDVLVDLPPTSDSQRRRALVSGDKKIIAFGDGPYYQVFDLTADPGELHPIKDGPVHDEMVTKYKERMKSYVEIPPTTCREGCLSGTKKKDG